MSDIHSKRHILLNKNTFINKKRKLDEISKTEQT